jgi:XTP/dITP diphosphohydrolase
MSRGPGAGPRTLLIASANRGKLRELAELLAPLALELRSLADYPGTTLPPEGEDYAQNAAAKAGAAARATGLPALGDDSGIEVAALGGAPGPLSARYGGPGLDDADRSAHLLAALARTGGVDRSARFVCVAALALPGGAVTLARGECRGRILHAPRGAGGFGYDPHFLLSDLGRTAAELSPDEKHAASHRGKALRRLIALLKDEG